MLNFDMDMAQEMLTTFNFDSDLFKKVITSEESWVYGYDIEAKTQSSQRKRAEEPRPKKSRQIRSNKKVLLTVFIDCNGVVDHECLPQGRMVNKEYCTWSKTHRIVEKPIMDCAP